MTNAALNRDFYYKPSLNGLGALLLAEEVLALPRVVTQVTLARPVSPPSHPCHCRGDGQARKALLAWDSTAAMPTTPPHGFFTAPLPAQWLPRWMVPVGAGWGVLLWLFGKTSGAEQELHPAGETGKREGKGSELSEASPQPVDRATLARFYPRFLQHPPCISHFSCIQIFYLFAHFSINSLMLVKSQPWRGKGGQSSA